jgi:hypothetical protein
VANEATGGGSTYPTDRFPSDTSVVFLHHSTGQVIWEGGVPEAIRAYNEREGTSTSSRSELSRHPL